jgi:hypothetical protein
LCQREVAGLCGCDLSEPVRLRLSLSRGHRS